MRENMLNKAIQYRTIILYYIVNISFKTNNIDIHYSFQMIKILRNNSNCLGADNN